MPALYQYYTSILIPGAWKPRHLDFQCQNPGFQVSRYQGSENRGTQKLSFQVWETWKPEAWKPKVWTLKPGHLETQKLIYRFETLIYYDFLDSRFQVSKCMGIEPRNLEAWKPKNLESEPGFQVFRFPGSETQEPGNPGTKISGCQSPGF